MKMTTGRAVYAMKTDLRVTLSKWWMIAPKMQKITVEELKPASGQRAGIMNMGLSFRVFSEGSEKGLEFCNCPRPKDAEDHRGGVEARQRPEGRIITRVSGFRSFL